MNTRGWRPESGPASSNRSVSRWPISYTDHHATSRTSSVYGRMIWRAFSTSEPGVIARAPTRSPGASSSSSM